MEWSEREDGCWDFKAAVGDVLATITPYPAELVFVFRTTDPYFMVEGHEPTLEKAKAAAERACV